MGYTQTGRGFNYQSPYGTWAGYTTMVVTDFNRAGERALWLEGSYDFKPLGIPGLIVGGIIGTWLISEAFIRVTLPLAAPGIFAGSLLTFIPAAGDYINAELLGTTKVRMIGNVIQDQFFVVTDYPTASALSFVLMLAILVLVFFYVRRSGTEDLV